MANWVIQCSESWLKPLYKHMKQELLTHGVIHADETVVQVLKEDGKPATSDPACGCTPVLHCFGTRFAFLSISQTGAASGQKAS